MGRVAFIPLPKANDYFVCLAGQEKNTLGFAFKHVMTKVKKESERPSLSRGKKKKKKERWFVKLIQILWWFFTCRCSLYGLAAPTTPTTILSVEKKYINYIHLYYI